MSKPRRNRALEDIEALANRRFITHEEQSSDVRSTTPTNFSKSSPGSQSLPIARYSSQIKDLVNHDDVLILSGETGSGKSTQVPQYLVNEKCCRPIKAKCKDTLGEVSVETIGGRIAITEPRRVAAISLANRVASERNELLGQVGYAVRFDSQVSRHTRIKFMTEGILLKELLSDPFLKQYSVIIIDEIHERSANVDILLGFLRGLVRNCEGRGNVPLKIVIMSATVDIEQFENYFSSSKEQPLSSEEMNYSSWSGLSSSDEDKNVSGNMQQRQKVDQNAEASSDIVGHRLQVSRLSVEGRQYPVRVIYSPNPSTDFLDETYRTICNIHCGEICPGDVLCFVTGQQEVESLQRLVQRFADSLEPRFPKVLTVPLYAALPNLDQAKVFQHTPKNTRKIVIATNIAETSITVPGIRYVIDCGLVKNKRHIASLGIDHLRVERISKSSADQRKGRAGRVAPGKCYRLYSESAYRNFKDESRPEILGLNLTETILAIKSRGWLDITTFPFLACPSQQMVRKSLSQLIYLGAIDETGKTTQLGLSMSQLPLPPSLARVLIKASEVGESCLADVIDIVSCLSATRSIFLSAANQEEEEEQINARSTLIRSEGDHFTLLNIVRQFSKEGTDRKQWAKSHYLSHSTLKSVLVIRKQLFKQCQRMNFAAENDMLEGNETFERCEDVVRCFLEGFFLQTASRTAGKKFRMLVGRHDIAIHPSSPMFHRNVEAFMYHEPLYTTKLYAAHVTPVQLEWIESCVQEKISAS